MAVGDEQFEDGVLSVERVFGGMEFESFSVGIGKDYDDDREGERGDRVMEKGEKAVEALKDALVFVFVSLGVLGIGFMISVILAKVGG